MLKEHFNSLHFIFYFILKLVAFPHLSEGVGTQRERERERKRERGKERKRERERGRERERKRGRERENVSQSRLGPPGASRPPIGREVRESHRLDQSGPALLPRSWLRRPAARAASTQPWMRLFLGGGRGEGDRNRQSWALLVFLNFLQ